MPSATSSTASYTARIALPDGTSWADSGFVGVYTNGPDPQVCFDTSLPGGPVPAAPPLPTSADDCKNNGWQPFGVFKNQGDCVSYVATHGKNTPAH